MSGKLRVIQGGRRQVTAEENRRNQWMDHVNGAREGRNKWFLAMVKRFPHRQANLAASLARQLAEIDAWEQDLARNGWPVPGSGGPAGVFEPEVEPTLKELCEARAAVKVHEAKQAVRIAKAAKAALNREKLGYPPR